MAKPSSEFINQIARKLDLSVEEVEYLRPRLLSEHYAGVPEEIIDSLTLKSEHISELIPQLQNKNKMRRAMIKQGKSAEYHTKKLQEAGKHLNDVQYRLKFYDGMIEFLQAMTPAQKNILMGEYETTKT